MELTDEEIARAVERVSLLLQDKPAVYLSDNLPDMEELSGADVPTRALNDFETESLHKLLHPAKPGDDRTSLLPEGTRHKNVVERNTPKLDVVTVATPSRIQMLGALRADHSCLQCHSNKKKGDLLGAFAYEFLRAPTATRKPF